MGDIIVLTAIGIVVALVIYSMVKDRKKGSSCSCSCACCEKRAMCHPDTPFKTE